MIPSRVLSLVFLLAFFAGQAEPYLGVARDGEVHHESGLAALSHTVVNGDHGHEDGGSHEHGNDHEHGTSADHCTHVHSSVALEQSFVLVLPSAVDSRSFTDSIIATDSASPPPIRPPIA